MAMAIGLVIAAASLAIIAATVFAYQHGLVAGEARHREELAGLRNRCATRAYDAIQLRLKPELNQYLTNVPYAIRCVPLSLSDPSDEWHEKFFDKRSGCYFAKGEPT